MSIKVMNQVWEYSPVKGHSLITLLALADWSDDSGHSFPSLDTLAKKSRQTIRSVQNCLRRLEKQDLVKVELNQGRGGVNSFWLNMKIFHVQTGKPRHRNTKTATSKHENYDVKTRKRRRRNKEEPSRTVSEPSIEPQTQNQPPVFNHANNLESEPKKPSTDIDPSQATSHVVLELGISGNQGRMRVHDSVKSYMHKNKCSAQEAGESLVGLWRRYEAAAIPYKKGIAKFFEDGVWGNPAAWGRKNGIELTKTQQRYVNNLHAAADDSDALFADVDSGDARPGVDARRVKNMG